MSNLVTIIVCVREDLNIERLSRFSHPGSVSIIGCTLLNLIRTKIEIRFLSNPIIFNRDSRVDGLLSLEVLSSRLEKYLVVSITVSKGGRRKKIVSLLIGELCLAAAAAYHSIKTLAPIHPVFTVYEGGGKFTMTASAELNAASHADVNVEIEEVLVDFSDSLVEYILKYADQFPWATYYT